jgi:hypothetical protein
MQYTLLKYHFCYYDFKMALGNVIIEEKGKITSQRVVDVKGPNVETSFAATGRYVGTDGIGIGTYSTVLRENGVLYGEGQGVITTTDDKEMATWTGQGIGRISSSGKTSFRGSLFFRIIYPQLSSSRKLSVLNNAVGVFEYEVDEIGNTFSKVWEWK